MTDMQIVFWIIGLFMLVTGFILTTIIVLGATVIGLILAGIVHGWRYLWGTTPNRSYL